MKNGTNMPLPLNRQPPSHSVCFSLTKVLVKAREISIALIFANGKTNLCLTLHSSYYVGLGSTSVRCITVCTICGTGYSPKSAQVPITIGRNLIISISLLLTCSRSRTPFQPEQQDYTRPGALRHESAFAKTKAPKDEILGSFVSA